MNTTGVTADTPGTSSLEAKLGGWGRGLRTLGVTRRSEPTTNSGVRGLRIVVDGGEHREAYPERHDQAHTEIPVANAQERLLRLRLRVPRINGPNRGGAGTGSRGAIAMKMRTASSMPPNQAISGASMRRDGSDTASPAETDAVGGSKAPAAQGDRPRR